MKNKILFFSAYIILISSTVLSQNYYLKVPQTIQEQTEWCWAATSSCVLKYYGLNIAQCTVAEYTRQVATWHNFGSVNCCTDPGQGCNYWNYNWGYTGSIQDILQHWNINNTGVGNAFSLATTKTELSNSRPFIIRWGWTTGGGHFLVGHGITSSDSMLFYMDPWFGNGYSIAKYNWVVSGSTHEWTHTNKITTNPLLPNVPVLSYPVNHSTSQPLTTTFKWLKCDRAVNYILQISVNSNFSSYFLNDSTITDSVKTVSGFSLNTLYYWRVCGKNLNGKSNYSDVYDFRTVVSSVNLIGSSVPGEFKLMQNYPNPFNSITKIRFDIPAISPNKTQDNNTVIIKIFDVTGREIETLINESVTAGMYEITYNASNLKSGIYFYRLITNGFSETKKLILLK